jgi:hypothetical protein
MIKDGGYEIKDRTGTQDESDPHPQGDVIRTEEIRNIDDDGRCDNLADRCSDRDSFDRSLLEGASLRSALLMEPPRYRAREAKDADQCNDKFRG